jgi:hypothetical protein
MNGHGVRDFRGADDRRHVEVAVGGRWRADTHGFVGQQDMLLAAIGLRVHRDRLDAEFLARPEDAQRDLAAVGNHDLV